MTRTMGTASEGNVDVISEASHSHPWNINAHSGEEDEGDAEGVDDVDADDGTDKDEALWEVRSCAIISSLRAD